MLSYGLVYVTKHTLDCTSCSISADGYLPTVFLGHKIPTALLLPEPNVVDFQAVPDEEFQAAAVIIPFA